MDTVSVDDTLTMTYLTFASTSDRDAALLLLNMDGILALPVGTRPDQLAFPKGSPWRRSLGMQWKTYPEYRLTVHRDGNSGIIVEVWASTEESGIITTKMVKSGTYTWQQLVGAMHA